VIKVESEEWKNKYDELEVKSNLKIKEHMRNYKSLEKMLEEKSH